MNNIQLSVFESGTRRAKENIVCKYATRYYLSQLSQGNIKCVSRDEKWVEIFDYVTNMKAPQKGNFLITINPPNDDLKQLQRVVLKIRSYQNFLGSLTYCYEVRDRKYVDNEYVYTGLHVHIFANDEYGRPLSDVVKRCRAASQQIYKSLINPKSTDVRLCTHDTIKYIQGEKKDPEKAIGLYYTQEYREMMQLPNVYYQEPITL